MSDASLNPGYDGHSHGDHAHPAFLAHHFDDAEQQYDAGKQGMWLFLVTEILFFSGMFCAYALFRYRNPEVFTFASQYLNATLGAFNTGVLLFSSLSMAWGVRCAQLRQRTGLVVCLAITLGCAAMFLGVKAVEYTHKWDMGLLPAGFYVAQWSVVEHHVGVSSWLYTISIVPAIIAVGFAVWYAVTIFQGNKGLTEIAGPLLVAALCYFLGVFIGVAFQNAEAKAAAGGEGHNSHAASVSDDHGGDDHVGEHGETQHDITELAPATLTGEGTMGSQTVLTSIRRDAFVPGAVEIKDVDQKAGAGLFFSIYYAMTGVHAIHILGGMAVLSWLLVRATKNHFNEKYFGPVDYVGLYWHLVDLIWIFLFPLLYLIK